MSFQSYWALVKLDLGDDLEKRFGPAGDGYQYHHIVEHTANRGRFAASQLNSTANVVRLPTIVHEEVSAVMGRKYKFLTGEMSLREFLRGASYEQQRAWGMWAMRQAGALK